MTEHTPAQRAAPNYKLRMILLTASAVVCILISFIVGRFTISIPEFILTLTSPIFAFIMDIFQGTFIYDTLSFLIPAYQSVSYQMASAVFSIRLPRILAAFFVGAALSTAGSAYQGMFQNPLVSPDILGASAGAGFGAALAIFSNLGGAWVTLFAFIGGLAAVGGSYIISRLSRGSATLSMVLGGILIGSLFSAGTSYIKLVADTNDQLPEITYWLMGSLAGSTISDVIFAGIVITIGIIPIILLKWRINLLTIGEDEAKSMGINTNRLRLIVITCATFITSVAVSISGIIGWIGLVVPHFCRMIFGYDYRRIIPASIILGGGFMLLVDDFARCIATIEVPIGILTAFIGAPVFAYLLIRGGKRS